MKRLALPFLLLCSPSLFASMAPNPADYTIDMHVSASQTQWLCLHAGCNSVLTLSATIEGHKYFLQGNIRNGAAIGAGGRKENFDSNEGFLALGDYKAKFVSADLKDPQVPYYVVKSYQILLSDGRLADFQVVGQTE